MSNSVDPDIYISSLLSQMIYNGTSRYLGWHGAYSAHMPPEPDLEQMRQVLHSGQMLAQAQIEALHKAFYRDELQRIVNQEIIGGSIDQKMRDELARGLFVALFTKQDHPKGFDELLVAHNNSNEFSAKDALKDQGRLTREGFYRAKDVHAISFTKMWDPQEGFNAKKSKVFVVYRGTENDSNPLQSPLITFLKDYVGKSYRNFSKSFGINYKDPTLAYLDAKKSSGEQVGEVVFCGHSLGGAMASEGLLQTGGFFMQNGGSVKVHTFGSPGTGRVGPLNVATGGALLIGSLAISSISIFIKKSLQAVGMYTQRSAARIESGFFEQSLDSQARQFLGRGFAGIINVSPLRLIDSTFQTALNVIDYFGTKARGLLKVGSIDLKDPQMVRAVEKGEVQATHMADQNDVIGKIGECLGFQPLGRRISVNSAQRLSLNPVKNHSMFEYVRSMEDILIRQPNIEARTNLMTMAACRKVVDQMVNIQLRNHLTAQKQNRLEEFLQDQLMVGTDDLHEMPKEFNKIVARLSDKHKNDFESHTGPLTKDSKYRFTTQILRNIKQGSLTVGEYVSGYAGAFMSMFSGVDFTHGYIMGKMVFQKITMPGIEESIKIDLTNTMKFKERDLKVDVSSAFPSQSGDLSGLEAAEKIIQQKSQTKSWDNMLINGRAIPGELVRIISGLAIADEAKRTSFKISEIYKDRQHPMVPIVMHGTGNMSEEQMEKVRIEQLRRKSRQEDYARAQVEAKVEKEHGLINFINEMSSREAKKSSVSGSLAWDDQTVIDRERRVLEEAKAEGKADFSQSEQALVQRTLEGFASTPFEPAFPSIRLSGFRERKSTLSSAEPEVQQSGPQGRSLGR